MNKLVKPEMELVIFNEDIITGSTNPDCTIQECTTECECNGPYEITFSSNLLD